MDRPILAPPAAGLPLAGLVRLIVESHLRLTGRPLLQAEAANDDDLAEALWTAPRAVVAHGTQADPIFCYGNRMALELFEMDFAAFTALPSRFSAEPMAREERASLLDRVSRFGFIDDYAGIPHFPHGETLPHRQSDGVEPERRRRGVSGPGGDVQRVGAGIARRVPVHVRQTGAQAPPPVPPFAKGEAAHFKPWREVSAPAPHSPPLPSPPSRTRAYSMLSARARQLASMMLVLAPTVVQDSPPLWKSMSTRVEAAVPVALLRMRTL